MPNNLSNEATGKQKTNATAQVVFLLPVNHLTSKQIMLIWELQQNYEYELWSNDEIGVNIISKGTSFMNRKEIIIGVWVWNHFGCFSAIIIDTSVSYVYWSNVFLQ